MTLSAAVEGSGTHRLAVRADNLQLTDTDRQVELKAGSPQTVVWKGKLASTEAPFVAVVFPMVIFPSVRKRRVR